MVSRYSLAGKSAVLLWQLFLQVGDEQLAQGCRWRTTGDSALRVFTVPLRGRYVSTAAQYFDWQFGFPVYCGTTVTSSVTAAVQGSFRTLSVSAWRSNQSIQSEISLWFSWLCASSQCCTFWAKLCPSGKLHTLKVTIEWKTNSQWLYRPRCLSVF